MNALSNAYLHSRQEACLRVEPLAIASLLAVMAAAIAGYLAAERAGSMFWMWITKPLASATFVLLALPPLDPWLFAALVLSFAGDLLLIPRAPRVFRLGILVFLLAHVAFLAAFAAQGIAWGFAAVALVPLVGAAILVARRILPRVSADLKPAVLAYMVVITAMVAGAAGASAAGASPLLLVAALGFYANDLLVARDRFLQKSWINRAAGLPLYYGAMVVFALLTSGSLV